VSHFTSFLLFVLPLSPLTWQETRHWIEEDEWYDHSQHFSYTDAIVSGEVVLPPIIYFAATNDPVLGNKKDVADFIRECHPYDVHMIENYENEGLNGMTKGKTSGMAYLLLNKSPGNEASSGIVCV
jgi:hypothetical protein